jgi:hypothetical protein
MQLFIKNYKIFHIVYKENFSSFQRKMSLDKLMYMGEVDGLSLIFVDLYVPALNTTPLR